MKKSSKIFFVLLTISLFTISLRTVVLAKSTIPSATEDFYVNDFAEVFTSEEKETLMKNAVNFAEKTDGIQVVVTTIKSLEGESIEDYAYEMYNQYKIGKDSMGILILLSTEDREIRVEVGKTMEGYMNYAKAGRLMDQYAIPSFKEDKFSEGLLKLQEASIKEISKSIEKIEENSEDESQGLLRFFAIFFIILSASFLIILILVVVKRYKRQGEMIQNLSEENEKSQKDFERKELENHKLKQELFNINETYSLLYDRYQRAKVIDPDMDKKIDKMIEEEIRQADMQKAKEFDLAVQEVIQFQANKNLVGKVGKVLNFYGDLSQSQKQYVKSNIKLVENLYKESLVLKNKAKALSVQKDIENIISRIGRGRAHHYSKLKRAKDMYEALSSDERKYFDSSIANRIEELFQEAKRDKRREEEEERRRRNSYHNSSGFDGGSSRGHSGFGGSSVGGGASRKF